jgi:membrane protease YdiL (CAAX protease family)
MKPIRLTNGDKRLIALCAMIFIVSVFVGLMWFDDAMPEASIDFQFNRADTRDLAVKTLAEQMELAIPSGFRHAGIFSYDNRAKVYLEKELGLESAQEVFGDDVHLWSWRHRWFLPGEKEEVRAWIAPDGHVVSLDHLVREDAEGADLSRPDALALADGFLRDILNLNGEYERVYKKLELQEGQQAKRPERTDWTFTWTLKGFEPVEGSDYRYEVSLIGDKPGGYGEYLHVPETWQADYSRLRSYNQLAGGVASLLMVATMIALVVIFIQKLRGQDIHWRTAIWFGIIAAILTYANQLNGLPNDLYGYDTTTSWSGFLLQQILVGLLASVGVGVMIALLTAGAESIFREMHPELPALPTMFSGRGLRTKRSFLNIVLGITMTAFFFAYQVLFYMAASSLGGWSPADVPYDNLLNTAMPWLAVLLIGFMPAVSEEFLSRMFSIPFLEKIFRRRHLWLAVVIPAFIWGFGHAGYPNQPFWIRGLEVGVAGVIVGWLFLRFGILAPLLWHYTVDAFYTGFLLFGSDNLYFVITAAAGAGLILVPLVVALAAYLRRGTFEPETGLTNADLQLGVREEGEAESIMQKPDESHSPKLDAGKPMRPALPTTLRIAAGGLLLLGLLLKPASEVGDFLRFDVSSSEACSAFADSLRELGWADPDTLSLGAYLSGGWSGASSPWAYELKHTGSLDEFNERAATLYGVGRWTVRAWKPENRLRFSGLVDGETGAVVRMSAMLPEEMPGESLAVDVARLRADSVMTAWGVNIDTLNRAEESTQTRPDRLDHRFVYETFEDDPRNVGEGKLRWTVDVDGGYISAGKYPTLKVPEEWERDREASTGLRTARRITVIVLRALAVGYLITLLLIKTKAGLVPWRQSLLRALVPTAIFALTLPSVVHQVKGAYFYSVQLPWNVFIGSSIVSTLITLAGVYLVFLLLFAALAGLFPNASSALSVPRRDGSLTDILLAAAGSMGALLLAGVFEGFLSAAKPGWIAWGGWPVRESMAAPSLTLVLLGGAVMRTAALAFISIVLVYLYRDTFRSTALRILLLLLLLIAGQNISAVGAGEWIASLMTTAFGLAAMAVMLAVFARGSAVRVIAASWSLALVSITFNTWQMMPAARPAAVGALVLGLALMVAWLLGVSRKQAA